MADHESQVYKMLFAKIREGVSGIVQHSPNLEEAISAALQITVDQCAKVHTQATKDEILRVVLAWVSKELLQAGSISTAPQPPASIPISEQQQQPVRQPSHSNFNQVQEASPFFSPEKTLAPPTTFTPLSNFSRVPLNPQIPQTPTKSSGQNLLFPTPGLDNRVQKLQIHSPGTQASPGSATGISGDSTRIQDAISNLFTSQR